MFEPPGKVFAERNAAGAALGGGRRASSVPGQLGNAGDKLVAFRVCTVRSRPFGELTCQLCLVRLLWMKKRPMGLN